MPRIFDNINQQLLETLKHSLQNAKSADFCVGYFNLRGWQLISEEIEQFSGGENNCCRLLIGMQKLEKDQLYKALSLEKENRKIDQNEAQKIKKKVAQEFRRQLILGCPNNRDELYLQQLKKQLLNKKLVVKLYLRNPLHGKLYLIPQHQINLPMIAFLGSSNLTLSGLLKQGELNIDVLEHDATAKLQNWFNEMWSDKFCLDISQELITIIDESWAREDLIPPYYIYLKMAYHLSQEARDGLNQYQIPDEFKLFEFQELAVKIATNHVNKRGGVIVGDVVGLGKTLIGTAIARICEEDFGFSTLIICPKNLVLMWENYVAEYGLRGKVIPFSMVTKELGNIPARFRLVLIDESHNLRNKEGQRYAAIKQYIEESDSRCILLTATPYNKNYLDLSAQLRLFIPEDKDLGIKPDALIQYLSRQEKSFIQQFPQTQIRSIAAFEKSEYSEDWQQLMSHYMVRRTRSFIKQNYAKKDDLTGRIYLEFPDGSRSYFPLRIPKTIKFPVKNPQSDIYSRLYSEEVINIINNLKLPRYGLGNYQVEKKPKNLTEAEQKQLSNLSRAGRRLMGFCRTNLFKRLESSGFAFIQSLERHILRNYIYIYALKNNLEIPIGTQDLGFLDTLNNDEDTDSINSVTWEDDNSENDDKTSSLEANSLLKTEKEYQKQAAKVYEIYANKYPKRFKWLRSDLFTKNLFKDLRADAQNLINLLQDCGNWEEKQDQKLLALSELLKGQHCQDKVLIFTQFADTTHYLKKALENQGIANLESVTGNSNNPTELAARFSPKSNKKEAKIAPENELRILIATDVLSEGQNLQDCHIIVNYDLPWAIIRLIQRAGRVDRIGQNAPEILCYSFLPAEGVENLINLRGRLSDRLQQNAEVVGTDEVFFEDISPQLILDLYHEKSGILDEEDQQSVDFISEAWQIWQNAIASDPSLKTIIENLPNVSYSTRNHQGTDIDPQGVLMYLRTPEGTDALAWIDEKGQSVTQSQTRILRLAACARDASPIQKHPQHHELVALGSEFIQKQQKSLGGRLGNAKGARARTYQQLKNYLQWIETKTPILAQGNDWENLCQAVEEIYNYPLKQTAIARLNKQRGKNLSNEELAKIVITLRENNGLCIINPEDELREAQIICSLGLFTINN